MEPSRFDALTRAFAGPMSRRRTLAGVVAAAIAPLTVVAKPKPAKCLANGKRCAQRAGDERHDDGKGKHSDKGKRRLPSCAKCCSRQSAVGANGKPRCACKAEGVACDNPSQCCGGICRDGSCTGCPGDLTACNGNCVDLQTDPNHCGSCANACGNGQRCQDGRCVCDGASCPNGCCDNRQTCQRGTSDQACGDGGAACQACGECHACDGTQCAPQSNVCCGDKAVCQTGACQACAQGQRCQGGACVCDATSCANGCCDGATCVSFADQTNDRCGTGGAACAACAGTDTCGGGGTNGVCGCTPAKRCPNGQTCGTAPNGCGGTIVCSGCAGCCDGNACNDGTSDGACGANGAACKICTKPDTCGGGNPGAPGVCGCTPDPDATTCQGKCGPVANNCGVEVDCTKLCAGCCDGATCRAGDDNAACGANGNACVPCQGVDTCGGGGTPGQCGCTPNCAGKNCGDDNGCGGACSGCPECQTCPNGGCPAPNGTPCGAAGSGLRCCNGACPPPPTCKGSGFCCGTQDQCASACCAASGCPSSCPGGLCVCSASFPKGRCSTDHDCAAYNNNESDVVICRCGACCVETGSRCLVNQDCCNGTCTGGVCN